MIDDHLKVRRTKHAQKERLRITNQGAKMITTSYNVIGKPYKYDNSIENISRIASITSGQFTNDNGHQGNLERDLMHDLNLCFPEKGQK